MIKGRQSEGIFEFTKKEAEARGLVRGKFGGGGKDGKQYFIDPNHPSIIKRFPVLQKQRHAVGDEAQALPVVSASPAVDKSTVYRHRGQSATAPLLSCEDSASISSFSIPEKARKTALAQIDLSRLWLEYRQQRDRVTEADHEFEQGYNSGTLYPGLYAMLGKVSVRTIRTWNDNFNASGDWRTLIHRNYHKNSSATYLTQEEASTFLRFLLHPNKIKIGTAIRLTEAALENKGIEVNRCRMTFRRFAEKFKSQHYDRWVLMREGQKALKDKVEPFIRRDPSLLEVGDVLVADGHRLNFQVINPFTGKPCRATLVGYVDWKSYDLAGYEIMVEENTQCIASALRNAILRLGNIPKITYQDNGKAFRARFFTATESFEESGLYGLFGRLGIIAVFAQPYNARAKIIERWFKEFSDTFERLLPSFTGTSIGDKPAWMLRNEKFHRAMHREYVPTIREAIDMIEKWLQFHRSQPCPHVSGRTIGEVFHDGIQAFQGSMVQEAELDDLMMAMKVTTLTRNGIRLMNADYYDDNLYGLREEVMIRYSLFDISQVKVYTGKGEFLCNAKRLPKVHPMAHYLGDPKDLEEFKQQLSAQKRVERRTMQLAKETLRMLSTGDGNDSTDSAANQGQSPQSALPWQQIAEVSPRVIDRIEKEDIPLPPVERHIPEECVSTFPADNITHQNTAIPSTQQSAPFFQEMYQRYEWLLSQGTLTEDDRRWVEEYKQTNEYRMLYQ